MGNDGIDDPTEGTGSAALLRRLRPLIAGEEAPAGWRDDLRLFGVTWLAGFLFFLLLIA